MGHGRFLRIGGYVSGGLVTLARAVFGEGRTSGVPVTTPASTPGQA